MSIPLTDTQKRYVIYKLASNDFNKLGDSIFKELLVESLADISSTTEMNDLINAINNLSSNRWDLLKTMLDSASTAVLDDLYEMFTATYDTSGGGLL